jgi:hypothetical protein
LDIVTRRLTTVLCAQQQSDVIQRETDGLSRANESQPT